MYVNYQRSFVQLLREVGGKCERKYEYIWKKLQQKCDDRTRLTPSIAMLTRQPVGYNTSGPHVKWILLRRRDATPKQRTGIIQRER